MTNDITNNGSQKPILTPGEDFGTFPGTDKLRLNYDGAKKIVEVFKLSVMFETVDCITDKENCFVDYTTRCTLSNKDQNIQVTKNANSEEAQLGKVWLFEYQLPEGYNLSKASKTRMSSVSSPEYAYTGRYKEGKLGKPENVWILFDEAKTQGKLKTNRVNNVSMLSVELKQYNVTNPDIIAQKNNIISAAERRALINAVSYLINIPLLINQSIAYYDATSDFNKKPVESTSKSFSKSEVKPEIKPESKPESKQDQPVKIKEIVLHQEIKPVIKTTESINSETPEEKDTENKKPIEETKVYLSSKEKFQSCQTEKELNEALHKINLFLKSKDKNINPSWLTDLYREKFNTLLIPENMKEDPIVYLPENRPSKKDIVTNLETCKTAEDLRLLKEIYPQIDADVLLKGVYISQCEKINNASKVSGSDVAEKALKELK